MEAGGGSCVEAEQPAASFGSGAGGAWPWPGWARSHFVGQLGGPRRTPTWPQPRWQDLRGIAGKFVGPGGARVCPGEPPEHSQESVSARVPPSPPSARCPRLWPPAFPPPLPAAAAESRRDGSPRSPPSAPHPLPAPPTPLPAVFSLFFFFFHSLKLEKTKMKRKKYCLFFLQVNPLIIFTFIYSCCFIKKIATFFFKKPFFVLFFCLSVCVCVCVSLFTVSAFCTVTVNPRVPTAREVGTPPRGHCRGVTQHRLLESLGTGVTLIPYGPAGDEQIPHRSRGNGADPHGSRGNGAGCG